MADLFGTTGIAPLTGLDTLMNKKKKASQQTATIQPTLLNAGPSRSMDYSDPSKPPVDTGDTGVSQDIHYGSDYEQQGEGTGGTGGGDTGIPATPTERTYETKYITADDLAELGLDESWVGLPLSIGYYDENGNWVVQKDAMQYAQQLHDLKNLQGPNITDITTSAPYQDLQNLVAQMNDPNRLAADYEAGIANFERMVGFQPGDFGNFISGMFNQLQGGIAGQTGLSPAEQQAWDRSTGTQLQKMSEENRMLIEAIGHSGRSTEAFMQADQIARNMADFRNQREMDKLNTDFMRKQTEYEALKNRMDTLLQTGMVSTGQYVEALRNDRVAALQGYAQQITALAQQNQTEIAAYQAHADVMYKSIMADLGVSEALMNESQQLYEQYLAPYYLEMDQWANEQQAEAYKSQQTAEGFGLLAGGAGTGAMIGNAIVPGAGALVGGVIGAIGGGIAWAAGGSVICTELYEQGFMDEDLYFADAEFGRKIRTEYPDIYSGYLKFAEPIVKRMKKSRLFTWYVSLFAIPWAKEMAYQVGKRKKGSLTGRLIMGIGLIYCKSLGKGEILCLG